MSPSISMVCGSDDRLYQGEQGLFGRSLSGFNRSRQVGLEGGFSREPRLFLGAAFSTPFLVCFCVRFSRTNKCPVEIVGVQEQLLIDFGDG